MAASDLGGMIEQNLGLDHSPYSTPNQFLEATESPGGRGRVPLVTAANPRHVERSTARLPSRSVGADVAFAESRSTQRLVAWRVGGLFEKSKNPSLTLLDVALSRFELDGSVGGVTG